MRYSSGGGKDTRQDGKTQGPLPQEIVDHGARYSLVQRVQALTLLAEGFSTAQVFAKTGMNERTAHRLRRRLMSEGFVLKKILEFWRRT
jgi:hypothetical protein